MAPPYALVPLRGQDIFDIKRWRNAQMDILRQNTPLTDEMQKQYFESVIIPSFAEQTPSQILFSFLCDGLCIGYGGLVHISWTSKRAEVSFLVDPQRMEKADLYERDFSAFLQLIKQAAFTELHLHRLFTETFAIRPKHIEVLEKQNFIYEGRMKEHVVINGLFIDSIMHGCIHYA